MLASVSATAAVPAAYQALASRVHSDEDARAEPLTGSDSVSISSAARDALAAEQSEASAASRDTAPSEGSEPSGEQLTEEEQRMVRELAARDREVRAHEQAHKAAAGDLASGGPTYTFQTGPDGKRYAVGGEVQIQLRDGRTPEETVRNMERAQRAALAPQSPSATDRSVASQAAQKAAAARREAREPSEGQGQDGAYSSSSQAIGDRGPAGSSS